MKLNMLFTLCGSKDEKKNSLSRLLSANGPIILLTFLSEPTEWATVLFSMEFQLHPASSSWCSSLHRDDLLDPSIYIKNETFMSRQQPPQQNFSNLCSVTFDKLVKESDFFPELHEMNSKAAMILA